MKKRRSDQSPVHIVGGELLMKTMREQQGRLHAQVQRSLARELRKMTDDVIRKGWHARAAAEAKALRSMITLADSIHKRDR